MSNSNFISIRGNPNAKTKEVKSIKFDSCKHRSKEQENFIVKTCCQKKTEQGFRCLKFEIQNIQPATCESCCDYESDL